MAAYSKRHYGEHRWQLSDPKLIVIHFAVAGSVGSIYNTFAPNRPDVEYGELPGVCSHYAVSAKGGAVRFVPDSIRCRHVVGLNHVSLGIEHVGFSDGEVLGRKAQLRGSLRLTHWLRCRNAIRSQGRDRPQREPLLALLRGAGPRFPWAYPRRLQAALDAHLQARAERARALLRGACGWPATWRTAASPPGARPRT